VDNTVILIFLVLIVVLLLLGMGGTSKPENERGKKDAEEKD
jgi:hypothetical protein